MRTKSLPGYGYIRYEVLPGDDQAEPGELIVVHEERRQSPAQTEATEPQPSAPAATVRESGAACAGLRGKLLARVFEMQGIQVEPELAQWLEKNLAMGTSDLRAIQIYGGQPLLLTALQVDSVARGLAEDLARCEQAK